MLGNAVCGVLIWPGCDEGLGVGQCWILGSDMARMGWVLGNAGSGVLIWPGWVGCWVMLDLRF